MAAAMTADKKPPSSLASVLGSKSKPADDEEPKPDYEGGKNAAAESVIAAVKGGDAGALATALSDFFELCS